jgi:hypothetical protein
VKLLERNKHNRGRVRGRIAQYAVDLLNGDWQVNGEAIKIDLNGQILDGQHRLLAIIEADTPMRTVLITGLDPRSQETMDQGRSRSIGDVLKLRGEPDQNNLAAAARIVCIYERDQRTFTAGLAPPTIGQILRTLDRHPGLRDSCKLAARLSAKRVGSVPQPVLITRSLMAGLHYLFSVVDLAEADAFMRQLARGEGVDAPAQLATLWRSELAAGHSQHARVKAVLTVVAWNAYLREEMFTPRVPAEFPAIAGLDVTVLRAGRGGESSQDAPRPADQSSPWRRPSLPARNESQDEAARAMLEAAS